jgi:hypothetical protein
MPTDDAGADHGSCEHRVGEPRVPKAAIVATKKTRRDTHARVRVSV